MNIRVSIDRSACRGASSCVRRAPGTFSLDEENKSRVAAKPVESEAVIHEAAAMCPFFAIQVTEVNRA